MRKFLNEEILIYIVCVSSYVLLIRVVFQYFETINDVYYKPDRIFLYLLYTGELIFISLFTPVFTLKKFSILNKQITKIRITGDHLKTLINKKFFLEIIIKAFVLLGMFHLITVFSIYDNPYFSYQSFFMILFVNSVFLIFIVAYTSFLMVLSRYLCLSIAVSYFTIISIFGCLCFVSPFIDIVDNPTPFINLTLYINPMLAISSVLNLSLFSLGPFNEITNVEGFDYTYPHWSIHVVSYLVFSILLFIGTLIIGTLFLKNFKNRKLV